MRGEQPKQSNGAEQDSRAEDRSISKYDYGQNYGNKNIENVPVAENLNEHAMDFDNQKYHVKSPESEVSQAIGDLDEKYSRRSNRGQNLAINTRNAYQMSPDPSPKEINFHKKKAPTN